MTTWTYDELVAHVKRELDLDYVARVAFTVAHALRLQRPAEVCLQPGDGTRYDLTFVPVGSPFTIVAPARVSDGVEWGGHCAYGVTRAPGYALVAKTSGDSRACAFDFTCPGFHGLYVGDLFAVGDASGVALAFLFDRVAEAWRDERPVYCHDGRHHEPCQQPCAACAVECDVASLSHEAQR